MRRSHENGSDKKSGNSNGKRKSQGTNNKKKNIMRASPKKQKDNLEKENDAGVTIAVPGT